MQPRSRRDFLCDVGRGMLVASLGPAVVHELGIAPLFAGDDRVLTFGELEPLVSLMQETPAPELQRKLIQKLHTGTDLKTLVAAGALANARTFGGEDYVGYHCMMALTPSYQMSQELPGREKALPVLKVLHRNARQIQQHGGKKSEKLHPVDPAPPPDPKKAWEVLRSQVRNLNLNDSERTFAAMAQGDLQSAFDQLQYLVQEDIEVHQVVLAWRAWDILRLTGADHAHTMLRQTVRFCVDREQMRRDRGRPTPKIRSVLPRLLEQYKLLSRPLGQRTGDDRWLRELAHQIYAAPRADAAEAAASALADGYSPAAVGEAMSLAANSLLLHDPGRRNPAQGRPRGSVHGASVGVHASDSANAWRNIAAATATRHTVASLIVGAYHTAGQARGLEKTPPYREVLDDVKTADAATLLGETRRAIEGKDQARACALVHRYGEAGHPARPVFDLLIGYAVSEDGALHAEKYYRTVVEEFARTRPAFRWEHVVGLARVTASEYGDRAPGYAEARKMLTRV